MGKMVNFIYFLTHDLKNERSVKNWDQYLNLPQKLKL